MRPRLLIGDRPWNNEPTDGSLRPSIFHPNPNRRISGRPRNSSASRRTTRRQQTGRLVVGVARSMKTPERLTFFRLRGLGLSVPPSCKGPLFDRDSLWRIPANINLASVPPPYRKLTAADLAALSARRAGNRGRANRR
jgi:hypothetical protein